MSHDTHVSHDATPLAVWVMALVFLLVALTPGLLWTFNVLTR